jgi:hypothetical protein
VVLNEYKSGDIRFNKRDRIHTEFVVRGTASAVIMELKWAIPRDGARAPPRDAVILMMRSRGAASRTMRPILMPLSFFPFMF